MQWSQQKQCVGIAYFVPVATRERPVREGGARENPSLVAATALEWDASLYPTKCSPIPVQPHTHTNTHVCHGNSGHTNTLRSSRCSCLAYLQVQQRALRREATPASASFFLFFCAAGSKNNTAQKTNNKINAQTDPHLSSLSNRPPFLLLLLPLLLPPLKVSDGLKPGNTHTQL